MRTYENPADWVCALLTSAIRQRFRYQIPDTVCRIIELISALRMGIKSYVHNRWMRLARAYATMHDPKIIAELKKLSHRLRELEKL
jgi:hypothetical protein